MSRVPKVGEVWTALDGSAFTCIDAEPDTFGSYGWERRAPGGRRKVYGTAAGMTPPKAEPPEWLKSYPWARVSPSAVHGGYASPDRAMAIVDALGAINVLTGEWVPRD